MKNVIGYDNKHFMEEWTWEQTLLVQHITWVNSFVNFMRKCVFCSQWACILKFWQFSSQLTTDHLCLLTHFFPDTDPSVCKHSIVLSHMAICSIISSQCFRYDLVRNYFADTSNPKNILFAKYWTAEKVLKLQNEKFWVFSCIYKTC